MKEVFKFTANEVNRLMFEELIRLGKLDPNKQYGMTVTRNVYNNEMLVEMGEPIPGAPSV